MDIQVRALFTHDAHSRLLSVNEPGGAAAPRFFLGRTTRGNIWRFRTDLSPVLIRELEALCKDEPVVSEYHEIPRHFASYVGQLGIREQVQRISMGPAYVFRECVGPNMAVVSITENNAEMLRAGFEELLEEVSGERPFLAIVRDGRAVSVCRSVRITPEAHEAGVETLPEFRGKGFAKEVAAGWARVVQSMGAIPLYSTSWENTASQSVARKLKLVMYGVDFHIT